MASGDEARWLGRGALAFLALAAAYQLICAFQSLTFLTHHVLARDDAYYYFQIARNAAKLGWATFDGVHPTNGVQLLWAFLVWGLAMCFQDRIELLRAILMLCVALNVTAGLLLWRVARQMHSPTFGAVVTWLWSGFLFRRGPTMLGVEYSLHIVIIVAVLGAYWKLVGADRLAGPRQLLALGVLLTLNYWNRLDSAIYSIFFAVAVVWMESTRMAGSPFSLFRGAALLGVPLLGAPAYAAACYYLGGTWMPISGLVKSYYASQHFQAESWFTSLAGHVLWWIIVQSRGILTAVTGLFFLNPVWRPTALAWQAAIVVATVWSFRKMRQQRQAAPRSYRLAVFLAVLWVFGAVHVAIVVMTIGHFAHVTQHYYGWMTVTWILWTALLLQWLLSSLPPGYRQVSATLGLVLFAVAHVWAGWARFDEPTPANLNDKRVAVAAWLNHHLPPDARVGAWNAGVLGYFSDRKVVNLDGLVNDPRFLEHLRSRTTMQDYLQAEGIEYVVDVDMPDLSMPYHAAWDHSRWFRGSLPWNRLEPVYVETGGGYGAPVFVLHVKAEPGGFIGAGSRLP